MSILIIKLYEAPCPQIKDYQGTLLITKFYGCESCNKAPKFEVEENVVLAAKAVAMPLPFHCELNVPWLILGFAKGNLTESVLRVSTSGSFAPKAACRNSAHEKPKEFK
ncbi:hypothetical protein BY996DRAFT_6428536 [Phakopsora pachyrhizi]|nr:hypothetical protein BY996DRAFT_6428536 [Phakopsora pachyrhizi]